MKGLCDQSLPKMGFLHPNEVSRITQHARKGEGRKEGKDGEGFHETLCTAYIISTGTESIELRKFICLALVLFKPQDHSVPRWLNMPKVYIFPELQFKQI